MLPFIVLVGFSIYRHDPTFKILDGHQTLIEKHVACQVGTGYAPLTYIVIGSGNYTVELLDNTGYNNFTDDNEYVPIHRYNLELYIKYFINLEDKYNLINGTCYILTRNPSQCPIVIKRKYRYISWWKYFLSEMANNKESFFNHAYSD